MGQKMDIFVPVDALVQEKKYSEAIDMLRAMLVTSPSKSAAIKERIASTELLLADQQIEEQLYNEALSTLSLFWAQNPERADQAQSRIRKINKVREDYNKKAKELLSYMNEARNRGDPDYNKNVTKKLEDLDALDRNNPDSKKTVTSLKETSLALVNQDAMKVVMSSGRKILDSGEYVQATKEYLKGFTLFKPEFDNAGYDDLTVQAVNGLVRQAQSLPDAYEAMQESLKKTSADLEASFASGKPEAIAEVQAASDKALAQLADLRQRVFSTGAKMAQSYQTIPKAGKSPIEYQYLAYLDLFTRGRPDSFGEEKKPASERDLPEGLGGVLLSQSESILSRLQKAAELASDAAYASAEKAYDAGDYEKAAAEFVRAAAIGDSSVKVLANWSGMSESDFVPQLSDLRAKLDAGAKAASRLASLDGVAGAGSRLSRIAREYSLAAADEARYAASLGPSGGAGKIELKDLRAKLDGYRAAVQKVEAELAAEAKAAPQTEAAAKAAALAIGDGRPTDAYASYAARLDAAAKAALASEYAIAATRGKSEGAYIDRELSARLGAVAAAEALVAGAASARTDRARAGYKDPSPTKGAAALQSEAEPIAALAAWVKSDLASMDKEGDELRAYADFASSRDAIDALGVKVAQLETRRAAALAAALEKKKAAAASFAKAQDALGAARSKLDATKTTIAADKGKGAKTAAIKKGFADARAMLESGLSLTLESSNADFDGSAWDAAQKLYASLSADLDQTKKDYTVAETFRLLGEGQTYYEQALFDLASESLVAAQEIWREENDADQEQVKYWQNLVKQASDTNNKREVRQSDAMYYEIGNYLSVARTLYLKGDGLMKQGQKSQALAAFDEARKNLSFVTRAFPLNADAGFLTLQILKSTDPDAYKLSLPRRVQEATDLLSTDPSSGYSRIADLYKMDPSYPGLKALLEKAEIKVGKRRAPPSKEDLVNAAALVAQAEKLLKTGRKDDAAKAETNLNAALTYEPTNKRALALLRDLKTLQGKTAGPSLGLADQAILDQATSSFASRAYNQARDELAELLADPNKRTREVLKLDNDLKTLGY